MVGFGGFSRSVKPKICWVSISKASSSLDHRDREEPLGRPEEVSISKASSSLDHSYPTCGHVQALRVSISKASSSLDHASASDRGARNPGVSISKASSSLDHARHLERDRCGSRHVSISKASSSLDHGFAEIAVMSKSERRICERFIRTTPPPLSPDVISACWPLRSRPDPTQHHSSRRRGATAPRRSIGTRIRTHCT